MKTFFNHKVGTYIVVAIAMVLCILVTGTHSIEAGSTLGKTAIKHGKMMVYVEKYDVNFSTAISAERYWSDSKQVYVSSLLKNMKLYFVSFGNETCEIMDEELYFEDNAIPLDNLNAASDAEKESFKQMIIALSSKDDKKNHRVFNQLCSCEYAEINGEEYLETVYIMYDTTEECYEICTNLATVRNGQPFVMQLITYEYNDKFVLERVLKEHEESIERVRDSLKVGNSLQNARTYDSSSLIERVKRYSFALWILLVPLVVLAIKNMSVARDSGYWQEGGLGQRHSKSILGITSVFVVMHHIVQSVGAAAAGPLVFLEDMGTCFVGLFFFFSGYGLMVSKRTKEGYLKDFLKKRLPTVLVPAYVCIVLFLLSAIIRYREPITIDILGYVTGWLLINSQMWYIVEIAIFYVAFYVIFRFVKSERAAVVIFGIFTAVIVCISVMLGHGEHWLQGEWWFNTSFIMLIGMIFARYQDKLIPFFKKHYGICVTVATVLFIALFKGTKFLLTEEGYGYYTEFIEDTLIQSYPDKFLTLSVQLPMVIVFVFLIILIGLKVKLDNDITQFLGSISLELYLIHNIFIINFELLRGAGVFAFAVLACSIIAASLLHKFDSYVLYKFFHIGKPAKYHFDKIEKSDFTVLKFKYRYYLKSIRNNPKAAIKTGFRTVVVTVIAAITLLPIWILFVNSTRERIDDFSLIPSIYFGKNFSNFESFMGLQSGSIYYALVNSIIISVVTSVLCVYLSALCAYALETYKTRLKKVFWIVIVGAMMIPTYASFVGILKLSTTFHLLDNYIPIIMPLAASPAAVYFLRMYLQNVKMTEVVEAARVDGLKEIQIFNRIVLPIILPALALQFTFSFVASWNNWYPQSLIIYDWEKKTIAAFVSMISSGTGVSNDPSFFALAFFSTLPTALVYILCSKSIVSSITLGAVKE